MDMQLISYEVSNSNTYPGITLSSLGTPRSLDEFDVNIFDISTDKLWKYSGNNANAIDALADFKSIKKMILSKKKAKIIFLLPQNIVYHYNCIRENGHVRYLSSRHMKNMLEDVAHILSYALPVKSLYLEFENTRTNINGKIYEADFHFGNCSHGITKSIKSEKITTISLGNDIYVTTLKVGISKELLGNLVNHLFVSGEKSNVPEWIEQCDFLDDALQKEIIATEYNAIENANQKILHAQSILEKNSEYKSILYTNGSELVEVIFSILGQILDCNLSDFIDEKKEDFLIQKQSCTFIGEIKGVTSNVKNEHISQVDVHYQGYMDKLADEKRNENVRQLLIINPFRTKPIDEREPVHEQQIALAKRNGCLIIETLTLLRIFEKFVNGNITSEQCIAIFCNQTGLLQLSDFEPLTPEELESFNV